MVVFTKSQPNPEHSGLLDINPTEVWEKRNELVLIDVRRSDEYTGELGHAPGAQLLTLDQLPAKIADVPKDKDVVFLCRSGGRSGRAANFARENGYTRVYNMLGGMLLWNELSLPIDR